MRDVKRIEKFSEEFNKLWEENFPDWRWGQLVYNFQSWLYTKRKVDLFFPEEDRMIELLKEYIKYLSESIDTKEV